MPSMKKRLKVCPTFVCKPTIFEICGWIFDLLATVILKQYFQTKYFSSFQRWPSVRLGDFLGVGPPIWTKTFSNSFLHVYIIQRWAAQHVFQVRNTQFHSFVMVVRKTQLRSVSKFFSALCAMPQLRILPLRTITVRNFFKKTFID